jgi:hypothetical protein
VKRKRGIEENGSNAGFQMQKRKCSGKALVTEDRSLAGATCRVVFDVE